MAHTSNDSAHSEILIRRSGVTGAPVQSGTGLSLLRRGEMAYSYLADLEDDGFGNGGDRLYIGTGNELIQTQQTDGEGDSYNRPYAEYNTVIGGKYFTDMMNHQRGTLTAASAVLVDDNLKIDRFLVDDMTFDGQTISSTGNLTLDPATGLVTVSGADLVVDSDLTVFGSATINDFTQIGGNLNVDGVTTLDSTTIDGDLTVNGNMTVEGDLTNISTTNLIIEDKTIVIADGAGSSGVLTNGAGIFVGDSENGNPEAFLKYNYYSEDSAEWEFSPRRVIANVVIADIADQIDIIDCGRYA